MIRFRAASALAAPVLVAAGLAAFGAAGAPASTPTRCEPAGLGADSFCLVNGLRLHYVDWGGRGPAIVLLTGLGDSARIFDEFAPLLTAGHRVIAVTRRGYGQSEPPPDTDYSNGALVSDVVGLLDSLGIARASFVGHSIAGGELAALGEHRADRVVRLVYLDAAYDRSAVPELMARMPAMPVPDTETRGGFDRTVRWRESALNVNSPAIAANLAQILIREDAGWVARTPAEVGGAVLAGDIAAKAHWSAIGAPSLALYSSKDMADQVQPSAPPAQKQALVDYLVRRIRPWMLRAQADFIEQSPCASALEIPRSTHYLFLERPQWTARAVLSFLASDDPCRWQADRLP